MMSVYRVVVDSTVEDDVLYVVCETVEEAVAYAYKIFPAKYGRKVSSVTTALARVYIP